MAKVYHLRRLSPSAERQKISVMEKRIHFLEVKLEQYATELRKVKKNENKKAQSD